MPISKIAETSYDFMRGVTPNGVCEPCGAMIEILSPTRKPRCSAILTPMTTPCPASKPSSVPCRICAPIPGMRLRSSSRTPRTAAPVWPNGEETKASPSITGIASFTPAVLETRSVMAS